VTLDVRYAAGLITIYCVTVSRPRVDVITS